jgi:hypothetical protein
MEAACTVQIAVTAQPGPITLAPQAAHAAEPEDITWPVTAREQDMALATAQVLVTAQDMAQLVPDMAPLDTAQVLAATALATVQALVMVQDTERAQDMALAATVQVLATAQA